MKINQTGIGRDLVQFFPQGLLHLVLEVLEAKINQKTKQNLEILPCCEDIGSRYRIVETYGAPHKHLHALLIVSKS